MLKIVLALLIMHLLATIGIRYGTGYKSALGFVPAFDFNAEKNFPSSYSAVAISFCAFLLWKISNLVNEKSKKHSIYWKGLSAIFVFLALDEYFSIHELAHNITTPFLDNVALYGYLTYDWWVLYLIIFGIIGLFFIRFFFQLPSRTKLQFIVAGTVFLFGAVVMEIIGGKYIFETRSYYGLTHTLIYTIEELLEMLGIILFISALMKYYLLAFKDREFMIICHITEDKRI